MSSLASPWYSFGCNNGSWSSRECSSGQRAFTHAKRRITLKNKRPAAVTKLRKKAKNSGEKKSQLDASKEGDDNKAGEWLVVCGTKEVPTVCSPSAGEKLSSSCDTPPYQLSTPACKVWNSGNVPLPCQRKNNAETWRNILRTRIGGLNKDLVNVSTTPYRCNLADVERLALDISDIPREQPGERWRPVLAWEKRLARKSKGSEKYQQETEQEQPSGTNEVNDLESKGCASDDSVDSKTTENMKDRDKNTLPVINLSGQMIQCRSQANRAMCNVRSRLLGIPRNANHANGSREDSRSCRDYIPSSDTSRSMDAMEPCATAMKLESSANPEPKINHTHTGCGATSTANIGADHAHSVAGMISHTQTDDGLVNHGSGLINQTNVSGTGISKSAFLLANRANKKDDGSSVHGELEQNNSLPPLRNDHPEAVRKKYRQEDSHHKSMKLPKVSENCNIVSHYNYQGNTSKLTKIKSCSLKDLTDLHNDKKGAYVQPAPGDKSWQNQLDKNVIDLNSYDMFARRSTRKYNTAKTIGMLILTKPEWTAETTEDLSREYSQDLSVCDSSSDNCQGSDINLDKQYEHSKKYSGVELYRCMEDVRDATKAKSRGHVSVNEVREPRGHLS